MTVRVLIADDEKLARERLIRLLDQLESYQVVAVLSNGEALIRAVAEFRVDICILDIHMPGLSGLELARQLNQLEAPPAVIFCTAHDQHALAAFEYQVVDYILKPVRLERLAQALCRVSVAAKEREPERLTISTESGLRQIDWNEVTCLLAEDKYVNVVTPEGQFLSAHSLKHYEQEQPQRLLRIHRNALVAVSKMVAIKRSKQGYCLEIKGYAGELNISRRHVADVRKRLRANSGRLEAEQ